METVFLIAVEFHTCMHTHDQHAGSNTVASYIIIKINNLDGDSEIYATRQLGEYNNSMCVICICIGPDSKLNMHMPYTFGVPQIKGAVDPPPTHGC